MAVKMLSQAQSTKATFLLLQLQRLNLVTRLKAMWRFPRVWYSCVSNTLFWGCCPFEDNA